MKIKAKSVSTEAQRQKLFDAIKLGTVDFATFNESLAKYAFEQYNSGYVTASEHYVAAINRNS
jgi:hypothetical protein